MYESTQKRILKLTVDKWLNLDHMTGKNKVTCPFAKSLNVSGNWGQHVMRRINWHLNIIKPCFPPAWCLAAGTNICRAELWMGRQHSLLSTLSASCFPGPDEEVNTAPAYCKLLTGLVSFSTGRVYSIQTLNYCSFFTSSFTTFSVYHSSLSRRTFTICCCAAWMEQMRKSKMSLTVQHLCRETIKKKKEEIIEKWMDLLTNSR